MSDKRRRYRKPKEEKQQQQRTITIARRQNDDFSKNSETEIQQPKILLKPKSSIKDLKEEDLIDSNETSQSSRTILISRNEPLNCQASVSSVSVLKDRQTQEQNSTQQAEQVPTMTRLATILSSTGVISTNAKKLLKDNTDFFVVGVIGTQGVGKSTILNLLANDDSDSDYYQKIFVEEDGYFPTKLKQHKCPSRSRTESTHMFITPERLILLDGAPVLCNSYTKDMTTNELDDLRSIVNFLSVCHLVIFVYNDYLNMNFLRLFRLAELMKQNNNSSLIEYFPNMLFVKNRATRRDFADVERKKMDDMLQAFFKGSKLRIYRGQTAEQQQRTKRTLRATDGELIVNSFVFPEVKGLEATPYHKSLVEIINDLRWTVFTTPRNEISSGTAEFTEIAWFELFEKVAQSTQTFFFNTYDEIHRTHLDVGSVSSSHNGHNRDNQDSWKD